MGEAMVNGNSLYSNIHLLTAKSICLNILYRKRLSNIRWGKKKTKKQTSNKTTTNNNKNLRFFFSFAILLLLLDIFI